MRNRHGRRPFRRAGREGFTSTHRRTARCRRSASGPPGCLMAEASEQKLDGQVFWLTALNGPGQPSRLAAVAIHVRMPDRLQRRPRDGFTPSSLLSPAPHSERRHLSRILIRTTGGFLVKQDACRVPPSPLTTDLRSGSSLSQGNRAVGLVRRPKFAGETRSHALRGNAVLAALRPHPPGKTRRRRASQTAFPRRAWERDLIVIAWISKNTNRTIWAAWVTSPTNPARNEGHVHEREVCDWIVVTRQSLPRIRNSWRRLDHRPDRLYDSSSRQVPAARAGG
ncbi:hypothetical protein SAMN05444166_5007 [Singulisphaera sp. GP187]|nr:hypothetical protein SAMN05444166_5007 [Singulisphaera sp. GP187]